MAVVKKKAAKKSAAKSKVKAKPTTLKAAAKKAKVKAQVKKVVKAMKPAAKKTPAKKVAKVKTPAKAGKNQILTKAETIQGQSNYYLIVAKASDKGAAKYKDLKIAVLIGGGVNVHTHPSDIKVPELFEGSQGKYRDRYISRGMGKEQFAKLFASWQKNPDLATLPESMIVAHFKGDGAASGSDCA